MTADPGSSPGGIQCFQKLMTDLDPGLSALSLRPKGFRRVDGFLRAHQVLTESDYKNQITSSPIQLKLFES